MNIPLVCFHCHNVCELLYSFIVTLTEEVFFTSEAKTLVYCLVFLDCFEILLFPVVKLSEFKPLMNGNMILLLMAVLCKVVSQKQICESILLGALDSSGEKVT